MEFRILNNYRFLCSCAYCDTRASRGPEGPCRLEETPGSGTFREIPNPLPVEVLAHSLAERIGPPGLHRRLAVTGGEPLLQAGFVARLLERLGPRIPVLLETNGTLSHELAPLLPWLATVSMDVKLASATAEPPAWDLHARFLETCRGPDLFVKVVVTPEVTDAEVAALVRLLAGRSPPPPLVLQPIWDGVPPPAWARRLLEIQARCLEGLAEVRILPQLHKVLGLP